MKHDVWFAIAMMWLSVALAVSIGIVITGRFVCLWFLLVPATMSFKSSDGKEK